MKRRLTHTAIWMVLLAGLIVGATVQPATTAPQPNEARTAWQLEFQHADPKPILVQLPGDQRPTLFWFMTFTVTNRTGDDRVFVPEIVLYTNTGDMIRAGANVNPAVFTRIKSIYNNPLMQDLVGITGKILQGQDNARDGVAIFRDFDPDAASFDIFVGGLSGETTSVQLPAAVDIEIVKPDGTVETAKKDRITLSKTLDLKYALGVAAGNRASAKPALLEKTWIMR